jgi:hypothetical protein
MSNSKSSRNAISHGAYSSQVVLPGENEQEFNDLHESFRDELGPNGALEDETVFDIARLHWTKRRLNVWTQLLARRNPGLNGLTDIRGHGGWKDIVDHLSGPVQQAASLRTSLREIAKLWLEAFGAYAKQFGKQVTPAFNNVPPATAAPSDSSAAEMLPSSAMPSPDATDQATKLGEVQLETLVRLVEDMKVCSRQIAPALSAIESYDLDETLCETAYRPELMERELKIRADIDKRIEKAMHHLVSLKEYKRLYLAKEVAAPRAEPITLAAES